MPPFFSIMRYFEQYEKIRKLSKNNLRTRTRWVVEEVTCYPYVSNKSILGEIVTVVSVDSEFVKYYYDRLPKDGLIPCVRPIKMFLGSFSPVVE